MKYEEHLWQLLTSNGNVWHILWQLMAVNATYGNFLSYDKLWQLILMQILPTFDNLWQYLATFGNFCQFLVIYCYLWQLMATYGNFWVRQLSIVSSNFAFYNFHVHFPFSLCMRCRFQPKFKLLIVTIVCPMKVKNQTEIDYFR